MLREVIPAWQVRILSLDIHPTWGVIETIVGPYYDKSLAEFVAKSAIGSSSDRHVVTIEETEAHPYKEEP